MIIVEKSVFCKIVVKIMNAQCLENLYNKNRYLELLTEFDTFHMGGQVNEKVKIFTSFSAFTCA